MKDAKPLFGTAGLPDSYHAQKHKNMLAVPGYLADFGLTAFEFQAGRGVRLSQEAGDTLRAGGEEHGITFSIHAPYYISMGSAEEEKREASIRYLLQSAEAVRRLGGVRVIFHPGSPGKQRREAAMDLAEETLRKAVAALDEAGYEDVVLCPETMGKVGQLGSLAEILRLCSVDKRITPCIDFGHLNARTQGGIGTKQDYADILDAMGEGMGDRRAEMFHVHFSKIEYTAAGERRHLTFADEEYGPDPHPLLELCRERALAPTIICESDGTQAEDAQAMRIYYDSLR